MAALISQYEDFPLGSNPKQEQDSSGQTTDESKNITKIVYAAIGLVVIVIIYSVFFSGGSQKTTPENSIDTGGLGDLTDKTNLGTSTNKSSAINISKTSSCGPGKNCLKNPSDCKCSSDEYCSNETKKCTKPTCGNGLCEPKEYADTCCNDCSCAYPACQICDNKTQACVVREADITDDSAIEAVKEYYLNQGKTANKIIILNSTCDYSADGPLKQASVSFLDSNYTILAGITDSGKVFELVKL
jgi:hypothetical protein